MIVSEQTFWVQEIKNQIVEIDEELKEARKSDSLRNDILRYTLISQKIELLQELLDNKPLTEDHS